VAAAAAAVATTAATPPPPPPSLLPASVDYRFFRAASATGTRRCASLQPVLQLVLSVACSD